MIDETRAAFFCVRGLVQGVGFRPFVFRIATAHGPNGWVRNADAGVEIHVEGPAAAVDAFTRSLSDGAPAAAHVDVDLQAIPADVGGFDRFLIREGSRADRPTAGISPDLPTCIACLAELVDVGNRRHGYPYINCTACGPRFSIVHSLPYAAARCPAQAAAGVLAELDRVPDMTRAPFLFPPQYSQARQLVEERVRTFTASSVGRLFDTVAALLGFTTSISFEGQAALWLEHLASGVSRSLSLPFSFADRELDFRAAVEAVIDRRAAGEDPAVIAAPFHNGLAAGVKEAVLDLCDAHNVDTVVLSVGVFQNELLLHCLSKSLGSTGLRIWTNNRVPPNDGGISLGQAAEPYPYALSAGSGGKKEQGPTAMLALLAVPAMWFV